MRQKLCEKCEKLKEYLGSSYGWPWLHCHHEEEKQRCKFCEGIEIEMRWFYVDDPEGITTKCKFCPECGRKL